MRITGGSRANKSEPPGQRLRHEKPPWDGDGSAGRLRAAMRCVLLLWRNWRSHLPSAATTGRLGRRFRCEDLPVTNAPLIMTTVPRRDFLVSMHSPSAASDQPWTATAALALSGCVYVMPVSIVSDTYRT